MLNPGSESGLFRLPFAALAIMFALTVAATQSMQAQTFTNLHSFTNGGDGNSLFAGPTMDGAGNIYGVTLYGGDGHDGTAFKLTKRNGSWTLDTLHAFTGGSDGNAPFANVTVGPDGNVYGTTIFGGGGCQNDGCGTVFKLTPPARVCTHALCPWTETVIYRFSESDTGLSIPYGGVTFDSAGNLYGTTAAGGTGACNGVGCGAVYKLTPSGGTWIVSVIYNFTGFEDGGFPMATMTIDQAGNLYGTTYYGSVFELVRSGAGWSENTLYTFHNGADGGAPQAGVVFDNAGNLYGATTMVNGGPVGGVVYKLTHSSDGWAYSVLYTYDNSGGLYGNVAIDSAGNIYGTALTGGIYQGGSVFKLTDSGGVWSLTDLHDFQGDGWPEGNVLLDASGNLYGTAIGGGEYGWGAVWEIQP